LVAGDFPLMSFGLTSYSSPIQRSRNDALVPGKKLNSGNELEFDTAADQSV